MDGDVLSDRTIGGADLAAWVDAVPLPAAAVRDGVIVHANLRLGALLGTTTAGLSGAAVADLVDPATDARAVLEGLRRTVLDALAPPVQVILRRSDGRAVPVALSASRLTVGPADAVHLVVGATVPSDATDGGPSPDEERFRSLVEVSSDWVWEVDADARYTYVSPVIRQILGYEPSEVLGRTPFDLMVAEDLDRVRREFRAAAAAKRPFQFLENTCRHRDGHRVVLETSGVPLIADDGRLLGYRGIDRDITDRRSAEGALREAEARYRRSLEATPLGLHEYLLEPGGRLVFVGANRAADEILGVDNRRFIGRTIEEAFPALVGTDVPERYRDVCRTGRPWSTDQVDYDHGEIRGAFRVHAYQTAPGRMAAMFLDITEQRRFESGLDRALGRLEQALRTAGADAGVDAEIVRECRELLARRPAERE